MKSNEIEHSVDSLTDTIQSNEDLLHLICDLDETIFNPLEAWKRLLEHLMDVSIDLNKVQIAGNLDEYFKNLPHYQDFIPAAEMLRRSPKLYENSTLIYNAGEAIAQITKQNNMSLSGYLSARPIETLDITIEELRKNSLPIAPVVLRSADVDFYSSSEWKVNVVERLLKQTTAHIVIIDDNIELINLLTKNFANCERLITILFSGPLSAHAIAEQSISSDERSRFYVGDWSTIPNILINLAKTIKSEK